MCGIAGFFNASVTTDQIHLLMDKLAHRGPDDHRYYHQQDVGLVHTRLSIIELSDLGSQPYQFENLVVVYNGEIYNFSEVRGELEKHGYSFRSNSDTEVLIKSFHYWQEKCVDHFIGMFAFAIYDKLTDELFVFRDRLGVKPLYYSFINGRFCFASELKALSVFNLPNEINLDGVALYFRFGYIPGNQSIYKSVSKLEAGHFLKVDRLGLKKQCYWTVKAESVGNRTENDWLDELEDLLISAFRYRMVSDVPVGIFLSGGIDSSLLAGVLKKHVGNINSFTIGFSEYGFDESQFARKVAHHLKIEHTEKILKLEEARSLFHDFYSIYDEPFADTSGIPVACVTQLAKQNGMKVVLSADGGDELFGGYTHYQKAYSLFQKLDVIPQCLRRVMAQTSEAIVSTSLRRKITSFNFEHRLSALEELLGSGSSESFFEAFIANQSKAEVSSLVIGGSVEPLSLVHSDKHPLQSMMDWDLRFYLPDDLLVKMDRATMFYGVEGREPMLDHRLVEFAMRIPIELKFKDGKQKYLLRKLLQRYFPAEYFDREKRGFSIPIFEWFSADLDKMFQDHLSSDNLKKTPFLNAPVIQHEYRKYLRYKKEKKPYNIEKMWRLLSFMMWHKRWM